MTDKRELLANLKRVSKATFWPTEQPDHAISGMVGRSEKRAGKKKSARKKKHAARS